MHHSKYSKLNILSTTTKTESCKETKRPPSSAITSERLNRLRLKRQVSVHSRLHYRLIGPGHLYRATRPSRRWHPDSNVRVSSLQSKPWFAEAEAPGLFFSTTFRQSYRRCIPVPGRDNVIVFRERSMHSPTVSACWNQVLAHALAYIIGVL